MSNKFKHGTQSDEYSDAFIESTINSAPKAPTSAREMGSKDSKARLMSDTERREWTDEIYGDQKRKAKITCSCGSATVLIFSIVLFLIGLGIIVFGLVEKRQRMLPLCPNCDNVINGLYVAGACVMFVSLFGMAAAKFRHKAMAIPFTFFLILLGIAFLGVGIAAIIYKSGLKSFNLEPLWHDAVVNDPNFICSVQKNLECSGFSECCFTNATFKASNLNAPYMQLLNGNSSTNASYCFITDSNGTIPDAAQRQCVPTCDTNDYTTTCEVALRNELSRYMIPFIAAVFPTAIIMFIMAIVSIKMTKLKDAYDQ